jgi:hypothetical protein
MYSRALVTLQNIAEELKPYDKVLPTKRSKPEPYGSAFAHFQTQRTQMFAFKKKNFKININYVRN